jgi:hypothetical protein
MDSLISLKCLTTCSRSKLRPPGSVRTLTKHRAQRNAIASPLLRLPPEIRNKIWTLAVQVDRVQVCTLYCMRTRDNRHTKGGAVAVEDDGAVASLHEKSDRDCCAIRQLGAFHLPEVCRQVYIETATLSYSSNIFLVGPGSMVYKNWSKQKILLAQRDAIARVELEYNILDDQIYRHNYLNRSLKQRGFRNLTHIHVPLRTRNLLVKDWRRFNYRYVPDLEEPKEFLTWCETRLKQIEGSDLVVVFEGDSLSDTDDYFSSSEEDDDDDNADEDDDEDDDE